MSENNQSKLKHEQQSSSTGSIATDPALETLNPPADTADSSNSFGPQNRSDTESFLDTAPSESDLPADFYERNSRDSAPSDTSETLDSMPENRPRHRGESNQSRQLPFFLRSIVNDLRLDDYHLISWRERREHFFWLLGFDRFPFRERGWVFIFLIFLVGFGGLWLSNPTQWDFYRNWRAREHFKQAVDALNAGQLKTAQIHLHNAYRHTPENVDILQKWLETIPDTEAHLRIGILLNIMNARPSGETAAAIVDELLAKQNIIEAASYAARQLTLHQDCARLWLAAGKARLIQKRFAVAREAFERAKQLQPEDKNVDFHLALVDVLMTPPAQSPDFSALESFRRIPELRQSVTRTLTTLYLSTDPERAENLLDSIITENPGEWEFQFLHFRTRLEKSPDKKAQDIWEDIWSRSLTLEQRLMIISEAVRYDQREIAENLMARINDEDRKLAPCRWIQVVMHINYKQWQEALNLAKESLENEKLPTVWQLRFLAGMALVQKQMGKIQDSLFSYREATRIVRDDPELVFFLSELLLRLNLQSFAQDSFEHAASMDSPFKEQALRRLLDIHRHRQDWDATYKTLERLHTVDPSNNTYIMEHAAMLLVERKTNHPVITSLLRGDLENLPLQSGALELIAHAHAQVGNVGKAARILQRLERGQPADFQPGLHRIATLAYLGKKDVAASAYAKLLDTHRKFHEREKKYLEEIIGR